MKLEYDEPLSNYAFAFSLRRYMKVTMMYGSGMPLLYAFACVFCLLVGRGLHSSTFQLNLSRF